MSENSTFWRLVSKLEQYVSDTPAVTPTSIENTPPTPDTPLRSKSSEPKKSCAVSKPVSRAMFKVIIDEELILLTKVRALEAKTTAASIVESALRAYLKP